ncbi:hypothetical protein Lal_00024489, partial [Lupinus albus]
GGNLRHEVKGIKVISSVLLASIQKIMATVSARIIVVGSSSVGSSRRSSRKINVNIIKGLNSFGGLRAQNSVTSLGFPVSTEKSFAKVVSSLKYPSKGRGGASSSTCNAAGTSPLIRNEKWTQNITPKQISGVLISFYINVLAIAQGETERYIQV